MQEKVTLIIDTVREIAANADQDMLEKYTELFHVCGIFLHCHQKDGRESEFRDRIRKAAAVRYDERLSEIYTEARTHIEYRSDPHAIMTTGVPCAYCGCDAKQPEAVGVDAVCDDCKVYIS